MRTTKHLVFISGLTSLLANATPASADHWGYPMGKPSFWAYEITYSTVGWPIGGIYGKEGRYIDGLGILDTRGYYSGNIWGGGGTDFEIRCPDGTYAAGLHGTHGTVVDSIGLTCRKEGVEHYFFWSTLVGGTGGSPYEFWCPDGSALRKLRIQLDNYKGVRVINFVQPYCD